MPFAKGRPFLKGQSGSVATQFKPGQSGNPHGRPKGRHAFIMRLRIPASLRKSLKLPLGATYEDMIAFARTAAENPLQNRREEMAPECRSESSNEGTPRAFRNRSGSCHTGTG